MKTPKAPPGIGKIGSGFWKKSLNEYELSEAHDLERLAMACKCLDDECQAEKRVKADGMFITNRYGSVIEHPACKTIRDTRLLFVKIIRELGLDLQNQDSRPPRQY